MIVEKYVRANWRSKAERHTLDRPDRIEIPRSGTGITDQLKLTKDTTGVNALKNNQPQEDWQGRNALQVDGSPERRAFIKTKTTHRMKTAFIITIASLIYHAYTVMANGVETGFQSDKNIVLYITGGMSILFFTVLLFAQHHTKGKS